MSTTCGELCIIWENVAIKLAAHLGLVFSSTPCIIKGPMFNDIN